MKKIIPVLIILICCGCGKDRSMLCTSKINNDNQNYKGDITYKIYYKGSRVYKIDIEEIYRSDEEEVIKYFDEARNIYYEELNKKYGGYSLKKDVYENKINLSVNIDYEKVNIRKMIKDGYIDLSYTKGGYLTKNGVKVILTDRGMKCE